MNSCYLCGGGNIQKRPGRVRDRNDLDILECCDCGLVFLSSFDHINTDYYKNSGMDGTDYSIESWIHDTARDDQRHFNTFQGLLTNKTLLDFGCGNGGFLIRAKELVSLAVGLEPDTKVAPYFQEKQLTVFPDLDLVKQSFDIITLFHVLEHLPDPINTMKLLTKKLNHGGSILIEVPNADDALLSLYQSRSFSEFTYWSCHLFLFNSKSLKSLAAKAGLKTCYIQQVQRFPLSNHLYWLAQGKPGGHSQWDFINCPELDGAYAKQLASIGCCDTIVGRFELNAQ